MLKSIQWKPIHTRLQLTFNVVQSISCQYIIIHAWETPKKIHNKKYRLNNITTWLINTNQTLRPLKLRSVTNTNPNHNTPKFRQLDLILDLQQQQERRKDLYMSSLGSMVLYGQVKRENDKNTLSHGAGWIVEQERRSPKALAKKKAPKF